MPGSVLSTFSAVTYVILTPALNLSLRISSVLYKRELNCPQRLIKSPKVSAQKAAEPKLGPRPSNDYVVSSPDREQGAGINKRTDSSPLSPCLPDQSDAVALERGKFPYIGDRGEGTTAADHWDVRAPTEGLK